MREPALSLMVLVGVVLAMLAYHRPEDPEPLDPDPAAREATRR
jgi:hypothetical protein